MMHKAWRSIEEVPYCFSRLSIKSHGHTVEKLTIWIQFEITRPVAAINSLRFALFAITCIGVYFQFLVFDFADALVLNIAR